MSSEKQDAGGDPGQNASTGDDSQTPGIGKRDDQVPDYAVEPVPKVPHKFGWKWALPDIIRIVFLVGLLGLIIVARQPCSDGVANFVESFSEEPEKPSVQRTEDGQLVGPDGQKLERLTPEQIEKRFGKKDAGTDAEVPNPPSE